MEIVLSPIYERDNSIALYSFVYKKKKYVICPRTNKIFRFIGARIYDKECNLKFSKSFIELLILKCSGHFATSNLIFAC